MKIASLILAGVFLVLAAKAADHPVVTYLDTPTAFRGAFTFRDQETGILFYVESDGRHLAAIGEDGKVLWNRDPFVDAKLEPYRVTRPVIVEMGAPFPWMIERRSGKFVRVNFDSSQCLIIDQSTGDPFFMGQD